ncbi:MAG: uroporphyrinogen-III C-methyltransferase [Paracoccaceae bacterium]|nr:uroporphyrinogen-III C-methyltransferase [Paracoccaceae bacterium]
MKTILMFLNWILPRPARHALAQTAAQPLTSAWAASGPCALQGRIALVGAGPGAADLLTLRAVQRLQEADIIFYDRLVDQAVLDMARREAERVSVGKEVGACSWPQDRINTVIVAAAKQGKRVVRLKSGDPGIFGRIAEELDAARIAGIPVEIVPGITAASGAAASLGRGLTERGATDRLMLATAACKPGDPQPDWAGMLHPGTSLAVYMGVRQARLIVETLRHAGVPMSLKVDIVSQASTPREKVARCTLESMTSVIQDERLENPAVILISWPKDPTAQMSSVVAA